MVSYLHSYRKLFELAHRVFEIGLFWKFLNRGVTRWFRIQNFQEYSRNSMKIFQRLIKKQCGRSKGGQVVKVLFFFALKISDGCATYIMLPKFQRWKGLLYLIFSGVHRKTKNISGIVSKKVCPQPLSLFSFSFWNSSCQNNRLELILRGGTCP